MFDVYKYFMKSNFEFEDNNGNVVKFQRFGHKQPGLLVNNYSCDKSFYVHRYVTAAIQRVAEDNLFEDNDLFEKGCAAFDKMSSDSIRLDDYLISKTTVKGYNIISFSLAKNDMLAREGLILDVENKQAYAITTDILRFRLLVTCFYRYIKDMRKAEWVCHKEAMIIRAISQLNKLSITLDGHKLDLQYCDGEVQIEHQGDCFSTADKGCYGFCSCVISYYAFFNIFEKRVEMPLNTFEKLLPYISENSDTVTQIPWCGPCVTAHYKGMSLIKVMISRTIYVMVCEGNNITVIFRYGNKIYEYTNGKVNPAILDLIVEPGSAAMNVGLKQHLNVSEEQADFLAGFIASLTPTMSEQERVQRLIKYRAEHQTSGE